MINVIVTKYQLKPPSRPLSLNGIVYDHWLNVDSGEFRKWESGEWKKVKK